MDTIDRIFDLLDKSKMQQQEFAALVGVSDDTASDWRRRRSGSYTKRLPIIAQVLNTTVDYLLTGKDGDSDDDPVLTEAMSKFKRLTPAQRSAVQMMIDSLAAQNVSDPDTK